jgi:hypothetical protein
MLAIVRMVKAPPPLRNFTRAGGIRGCARVSSGYTDTMGPSLRFSSLRVVGLAVTAVLVGACSHGGTPAASPKNPPATVATKSAANAASGARRERVVPNEVTPAEIDRALRGLWAAADVSPAPRADDATFLRRAYVDLVGTVPLPDDTARFLADPAPDKRARLIGRLLALPAYADHWMNYWDDALMGRETRGNLVDRGAFRAWLRARFAAHTGWDRIVYDLVSATGENSLGGSKRSRGRDLQMQIPMGMVPEADESPSDGTVNGAVNWTLRFEQSPQDLGASASRIFLGIQIQCAQCHDHKTERWTQEDFQRFSSAFFHARVKQVDEKEKGTIRRVELVDLAQAAPRFAKNPDLSPIVKAKPTALDGTDVDKGLGTRKAMATWLTARENPWFAKAFVNRIWGHLLGRGFFDPVDDLRPSKLTGSATAPELLDRLASDFAAHDFDVEHLLRLFCATEAYQLAASRPRDKTDKAEAESKLWARFHLVPLGPEELLNAILRVTDLESTARSAGIKDFDVLRSQIVKQYAFLFDTDEEADEPDYSGTVSQALALLNGALVARGARVLPGSAMEGLFRGGGTTGDKIDLLTVRVLARHPTTDELERWTAYVDTGAAQGTAAPKAKPAGRPGERGALERLGARRPAASGRQAAYEDILWSMLNSSEFTFNH